MSQSLFLAILYSRGYRLVSDYRPAAIAQITSEITIPGPTNLDPVVVCWEAVRAVWNFAIKITFGRVAPPTLRGAFGRRRRVAFVWSLHCRPCARALGASIGVTRESLNEVVTM